MRHGWRVAEVGDSTKKSIVNRNEKRSWIKLNRGPLEAESSSGGSRQPIYGMRMHQHISDESVVDHDSPRPQAGQALQKTDTLNFVNEMTVLLLNPFPFFSISSFLSFYLSLSSLCRVSLVFKVLRNCLPNYRRHCQVRPLKTKRFQRSLDNHYGIIAIFEIIHLFVQVF